MRSIACLACGLMLAGASAVQAQHVVAHRGHWDTDGSAQNSVRSLVKADSIGCHASEFDVWITADGVPVVHHDADAAGMVIETAHAAEICGVTLANGEHIPTLAALLDTAAALSVRLVCEIKPHADKTREAEAVRRAVAMIEERGLDRRTDYITFSREALEQLVGIVPQWCGVYYLGGDMSPEELRAAGAAGPDYSMRAYEAHPGWMERARELGMKVNVWTVNTDEDLRRYIDAGVDFITTNRPERLQQLIAR
ncbi:MAG: glycerophosphodiester phosphodiesterase [Bacteroides sp.]|nr:glycerophosphodiester phosphodiesterase [Bacteroides sp.]MCM1095687.1 hypothetical protein [Terasakiella sp.]